MPELEGCELDLLRQMLRKYPACIHIADESGTTRAVSGLFLRTFSLSEEDILDNPDRTLFDSPVFKDKKLQKLLKSAFSGETNTSGLVQIGSSGEPAEAPLLFKLRFFPVEAGEQTLAGILYENVSESAILQRELLAKNAELESFVYTVSHDLKSPLSVIDGVVQLLLEDIPENDPLHKNLSMISRSTKRISSLANSLLSLSRAARTLDDSEDSIIDTRMIVKSILSEIQELNPQLKMTYTIHDLPVIAVSSDTVHQLFQNLIGNAVKYRNPDRALHIEISSRTSGGRFILAVSDNGIGIDRSDLNRVFEVFYRGDNVSSTDDVEGTGVGLSIVRKIVGKLSGKVWVESERGEGSTFFISLPARSIQKKRP